MYLSTYIISKKGSRHVLDQWKDHLPFDAIIVPGVPPDDDGTWNDIMKARVLWSYALYQKGYAKNIIYSGGAVYSPYTEAVVMGQYAMALGIPAKNILYDTKARHSTENLFFSYQVARQAGFKTVALATDPFQSLLLRYFTWRHFKAPVPHLRYSYEDIIPYLYLAPGIDTEVAKVKDFISLADRETPVQRIAGTLGMGIDWTSFKNKIVGPL